MELLHGDSYVDSQPLTLADEYNNNYTAQIHNFDTSVYELNQLCHSQRPLLPKGTWYSLSQDDKSKWDQLTDSGKQAIIDGNKNQPHLHQKQYIHPYTPLAITPSIHGNQPSNSQKFTRKLKMHDVDSEDFAEFYKV